VAWAFSSGRPPGDQRGEPPSRCQRWTGEKRDRPEGDQACPYQHGPRTRREPLQERWGGHRLQLAFPRLRNGGEILYVLLLLLLRCEARLSTVRIIVADAILALFHFDQLVSEHFLEVRFLVLRVLGIGVVEFHLDGLAELGRLDRLGCRDQ